MSLVSLQEEKRCTARGDHVIAEAETEIYKPKNAKGSGELPEARKRQERVQENRLQRKHGPVDLDLNF